MDDEAARSSAAQAGRDTALWDGAVNARDLHGIGGVVQAGRIYRMGRHEWVSEAGWKGAWNDGVRTVIDLRNAFEVGRRETDPPVAGEVLRRFTFVNLATEDQSDAEFMELCGPYLSSPEYYRDNLERWPEKFVDIARAFLAAPPGGVVVHCAAGRDRTGMVLALLLAAAGVPHEAIIADYTVAVTAMNDRYRGQETPHETPKTDAELALWLDYAREHLEKLLTGLDAASFLGRAGLTDAELSGLRARLTDPRWQGPQEPGT